MGCVIGSLSSVTSITDSESSGLMTQTEESSGNVSEALWCLLKANCWLSEVVCSGLSKVSSWYILFSLWYFMSMATSLS